MPPYTSSGYPNPFPRHKSTLHTHGLALQPMRRVSRITGMTLHASPSRHGIPINPSHSLGGELPLSRRGVATLSLGSCHSLDGELPLSRGGVATLSLGNCHSLAGELPLSGGGVATLAKPIVADGLPLTERSAVG
jgi:hypothetical protein